MWLKSIFAIVALSASVPALAQEMYFRKDHWSVISDPSDKTCSILANFEEELVLLATYDAALDGVRLKFAIPEASSRKDGEELKLKLLFMDTMNNLDSGWGEKKFVVSRMGPSETPIFVSGILNREVLDDLARNKFIALYFGDKLIISLNLSGSAVVVSKLRKCAFEAAGLNADDPFLQ